MLLRDPSPPFHPPSQPHTMMVACPPDCPTPLPMMTLPAPLHAYPTFATKFKGKASISWVDKMGGSAARGQVRSKTSNGKGWLGVLEEIRGRIWIISPTLFIWFGWWWPRRCLLRWKDKTEMDCPSVAAWKRDGYVALLLPIFLPSTAWVPYQDLCSKETEREKEDKDRENRKLQCGKWWKVNQGGGRGCVCKAAQWHQALCDQWSQQGQHRGRRQWRMKPNRQWNCNQQWGGQHWRWWYICALPRQLQGLHCFWDKRRFVDWLPIIFRCCQWGRQWYSTSGICGLNKNNNKLLIEVEAEDVCVGSHRENRCIDIDNDKDNNKDDTKILWRSKELTWGGLTSIRIGSTWQLHSMGHLPETQFNYGAGEVKPGLVWYDSILETYIVWD